MGVDWVGPHTPIAFITLPAQAVSRALDHEG